MRSVTAAGILCTSLLLTLGACSGDDSTGNPGGSGGSGTGGASGTGGSTGTGGAGDTGGTTGTGGGSETGGSTGTGGDIGSGGSGGDTGTGGAAGGGTGGSSGGNATPHPFGSHTFTYPAGSIKPTGTQQALDDAVAAFYNKWKASLVKQACGGYYVHSGGGTGAGANTITVSEGHGYGMAIVPMMAGKDPEAQKIFDGMYAFFRKFPSINNADLMDWEVHSDCTGPKDTICAKGGTCDLGDSATDGDLDIAYGLLVAHAQWGSSGAINYLAEAKKVITALLTHVSNPETHLILMGDWADIKADYYSPRYDGADGPYANAQPHTAYYYGTRPSDFTLDHFKAFGTASGNAGWTAVVDATYTLIDNLQTKYAPNTGLLPDFVEAKTVASATPAKADYLEGPEDGQFAYNACRVPWRIGTDYIATGESRAKAAVDKMNTWIKQKTAGNPKSIGGPYTLAGSGSGGGQEFEAPFGVAAMSDAANQAWLDAIYKDLIASGPSGYYGGSIAMMSLLVMSGNWFQP
jgi:endo-1,4-beta-D-glucanase Y